MIHKSAIQPLCRYCGGPIRKWTHTVYFGRSSYRPDDYSTSRTEKPRTKEEAQRLVNQQIVSMRWTRAGERAAFTDGPLEYDWIDRISTWDGESYVDRYFCNGEHAKLFAYAAVQPSAPGASGLGMPEYWAALERQQEKLA